MSPTEADYEALTLRECPDGVVVATVHGEVLHWNTGAEELFGYTGLEARGRTISELIVPADRREEEKQTIAETLERGFATFESLRHRKDGTLVYVDISSKAIHAHAGDMPVILYTKKDVTQLKVQRDTKLVEARFRELLELTPDGIVIANPTGHIVFANGHAERLFGYERGELRGRLVELLLPERFHTAHRGHRSHYFSQPRTRAMGAGLDLNGVRKDGSEFPVEISLSPLQLEETALAMSAIRDVTERKRFEMALQKKTWSWRRPAAPRIVSWRP